MAKIPHTDFKEQLLQHVDIVELIKRRIALKKEGHYYVAKCPFHDEKTASFKVNSEKQFYYCFGCNAHGNAIDFLIAYDRMEFKEALAYLSQLTGISPSNQHQIQNSKRKPLYALMEKVCQHYRASLLKSAEAREYLKMRGLDSHILEQFAVGYAANDWHNLQKVFGSHPGITKQLLDCGMLVQKNSGQTYDRFRHRIMFPIRDVQGHIIGFGGRSIDHSDPKYLNSPETDIFHKSYELYGLYETKQQKRDLKQLIVVEGYMDVITLHQHRFQEAVATLGTALNRHHLHKLLRYSNNILFCFDGDQAGKNAAWKALTTVLPLLNDGIQINFLFLPNKEDPDSLIRKMGHQAFQAELTRPISLSAFLFKKLQAECSTESIAGRASYAKKVSDLLNTMPNGVMRQLMLAELAKWLSISQTEIATLTHYKENTVAFSTKRIPQFKSKRLSATRHAISLLLQQPALVQIAGELSLLKVRNDPEGMLLLRLLELFKNDPHMSIGQLLTKLSSVDEQRTVAELSARELCIPQEGFLAEFQDCLAQLQRRQVQQEIQQLIAKAKTTQLTPEEKKHLQQLLQHEKQND